MRILANYNFNEKLIDEIGGNFDLLYRVKKRNSCFAFAYQNDNGEIIALRDHLGIVPLYFRFEKGQPIFETSLNKIVREGDELSFEGAKRFIAHKTPIFESLVREIKIVPPGSVVKIASEGKKIEIIYQFVFRRQNRLQFSLRRLLEQFDSLMAQATQRILEKKEIALYLSGGADSGLVGVYLKKAGTKINAYTVAPWGMKGSEVKYARLNAEAIGVDRHVFFPLETKDYEKNLEAMPEIFGTINGLATSIGIAGLWRNTDIGQQGQIFGSQNADTMFCSMPHQYYAYFLSWLPVFLKRKLHYSFRHKNALADYLDYCTHGFYDKAPDFFQPFEEMNFDKISFLAMAGMYLGHTPPDGAVLAAPAVNRGIYYANPFYDLDLIEWAMRVPLKCRFAFSSESKIKIALVKKILKKTARKFLPDEIVFRKKGFIVPMQRDEETKLFSNSLPNSFSGINLEKTDEKLAGFILKNWCQRSGIKINL
ncbi:MAG: asparagine synthase-related protein [Candidatus Portnoybacteria bacterium]|nr:asparagine synthase-related protein [Candidatus Portnoybacteria bacterium]